MQLLNRLGYTDSKVFQYLQQKLSSASQSDEILTVIAELIRYNTLLSVARAGTGHLGASLSIVELLTEIYFRSFNFSPERLKSKDRDILILSKGHAAPSLYATLAAKGYIKTEELDRLRRLNGLPGHCDIETPGIEANTGSLAMGLSKAAGHAIGKKRFGLKGLVIAIIGNGELQEGQCWEALLSAASFGCDNLYIVVDDNEMQTDQHTKGIVKYGNLVKTFQTMGFAVEENKGKDVGTICKVFDKLKKNKGKPKLFYCHTTKGQGISFMEHLTVLKDRKARYIWHNKAPNLEQLNITLLEVLGRVEKVLKRFDMTWDLKIVLHHIPKTPMNINIQGKSLIEGFSQGLVNEAKRHKNFVVFDGDLEEDCGFIEFHKKYPKRFFEMGIMEQHMVSTASAFAKLGFIPVISTYAAFLTSRANEQVYNLVSEGNRALIVGNMAGVIPATPGKSHQAFRDIACMKNIPGIFMYQPVTLQDTENILRRYFKGELGKILYLRLSMASSAIELMTPYHQLKIGSPQILRHGKDAIIIGIGPVILGECMLAVESLAKKEGIEVEVWNYPWIVDFDKNKIIEASKRNIPLVIVEDHYIKGGMGESLLSFAHLVGAIFRQIKHLALQDFPKTGFRNEALKYFSLDRESISQSVLDLLH